MSFRAPIQGLRTKLGAELNTTPVTGANDTVIGNSTQYWTFFTMPTASDLAVPTGIEWKNGTVINGTVEAAIYEVDANPPSSAQVTLVAFIRQVSQSGASSVQRSSAVQPVGLLQGGKIYGAFVWSSSASGTFLTATVSSNNNKKSVAYSSVPAVQNGTSWTAGTEEAQVKVYYKPVA